LGTFKTALVLLEGGAASRTGESECARTGERAFATADDLKTLARQAKEFCRNLCTM